MVGTVKVERIDGKVLLYSPYHPSFPARAKSLGGRWDAAKKAWKFDSRDEARVGEICREVYGVDPFDSAPPRLVTAQIRIDPDQNLDFDTLWAFDRQIAQRPQRDAPVQIGKGCAIVSGQFWPFGGSMRSPQIGSPANGLPVIIEVRDVPASVITNEIPLPPDRRGLQPNRRGLKVEVVDDSTPPASTAEVERILSEIRKLDAESRKLLLSRIAEELEN